MSRIASRRFSLDDQHWFASNSGDWNPVHVDAVAARRTVAGAIVVHGIHAVLWALDAHLATATDAAVSVNATFLKPTPIDADIVLERTSDTDGGVWLEGARGDEVLFTIRIAVGSIPGGDARVPGLRAASATTPRALSFDALKDATGSAPIQADLDALRARFPHASDHLDVRRVAAMMTVSQIVGMECPGLHSLLSSVDFHFDVPIASPVIDWRVVRHRSPAAPLQIAVDGGGLAGSVAAFVRPAPVAQPRALEFTTRIAPDECAGHRALVIGGSRGLGEVVAKAVAAGGGDVVLTYHTGENDARQVAADIASIGGTCRVERLNAIDADANARRRLVAYRPTHLYYFATPRIGAGQAGRFDDALSTRFHAAYVDGFANLVRAAADGGQELRVFYPSSVFVTEPPATQMEYAAAKSAGEAMCRELTRQHAHLGILVSRLPRLSTDQTASLIGSAPRSAVDVMIDVVRRLHHLGRGLIVDDPAK